MDDDIRKRKEFRERFLRSAYEIGQDPETGGFVQIGELGQRLGLDPHNNDTDRNTYMAVAQFYEQRGLLKRLSVAYNLISLTPKGIEYVEEGPQKRGGQTVTFNVGNAYGSIFGTQPHAEMNNVSFDFRSVEMELERAEQEIDKRGGPDADVLRELIAEVREIRQSGEPVQKGRLERFLGVIQDNGWIAGPIAGTLLSQAVGAG